VAPQDNSETILETSPFFAVEVNAIMNFPPAEREAPVQKSKAPPTPPTCKPSTFSELICPLDVHSGKSARELGLLNIKQNNWKAAKTLTQRLKEFDPEDPVKYDFALFGYGIETKNKTK